MHSCRLVLAGHGFVYWFWTSAAVTDPVLMPTIYVAGVLSALTALNWRQSTGQVGTMCVRGPMERVMTCVVAV